MEISSAALAVRATCRVERDAGARGQLGNNKTCAGGWGRVAAGWRPGAVEDAGDVVVGFDDLADAHAAAALATEGDIDGEHAGEELGPPEAARPRRGFGVVVGPVVRGAREAEREVLHGRRDGTAQ